MYWISLAAGEVVEVTLEMAREDALLYIVDPAEESVADEGWNSLIGGWTTNSRSQLEFAAAVQDDYYIVVKAARPNQPYTLTTRSLPSVPAQNGSEDVPGSGLAVGQEISSIVDSVTRPLEVYSVSLAAGEVVEVTLEMAREDALLYIVDPAEESVADEGWNSLIGGWTTNSRSQLEFAAAVQDDYYIVVKAARPNQPYTLNVEPGS